jgi:zinc protease
MRYYPKTAALLLMLLTYFTAISQSTQIKAIDNSIYEAKQINGLNALISPRASTGNVKITLYVKTGPVYENDSVSGISNIIQNILADKIAACLRKSTGPVTLQNTALESYTTTELSTFQLTTAPGNYPFCLELLRDSIFLSEITEEEVISKIETIRKEINESKTNYKTEYQVKLLSRLYRKDLRKQLVIGDTSGKFPYVDWVQVLKFRKKYYAPNNTLVNAMGAFDLEEFQNKLAKIFNELHKSEFDPELITKIVDFKPMVYSTQFAVTAPLEQPQFEICYQFPGVRSNMQSSYYAFLLCAILNDPNCFIQIKARKLGCKKIEAVYDASNFSGIFKVVLQPDKQHFFETYNFVLKELSRLDETVINESMMKVGMLNFQKEYNNMKNSPDYMQWMTKYWVYDDETYISTLKDSVFLLGERRMRKFVIEYFNRGAHVTGLTISETDRAQLKTDSLLPELGPEIHDYVFHYRQNITDLEGPENLKMQSNLLEWLKRNPDLVLQVNGCSDEGEVSRVKDDSIRQFIDSIPTFAKVKQDMVKSGSLRVEMMRAMKIIKYLYDNGIEMERLKGTSMPFSSKTREEAIENQKCTLTIDKIRKAPSVYEYHYGKKKPDDEYR